MTNGGHDGQQGMGGKIGREWTEKRDQEERRIGMIYKKRTRTQGGWKGHQEVP